MRPARLILTAATAAALALSAGCSTAEEPPAEASSSAEPSSSTPSSSAAPAEEDTASASEPAAASTVLMATTGTQSDPGAFEIALTDADGEPVTSVPAGDYTIEVQDYSKIHNFHLTGDGVDESTTVAGTGATTWQVSLSKGGYEYVCDPHEGTMNGALTVT